MVNDLFAALAPWQAWMAVSLVAAVSLVVATIYSLFNFFDPDDPRMGNRWIVIGMRFACFLISVGAFSIVVDAAFSLCTWTKPSFVAALYVLLILGLAIIFLWVMWFHETKLAKRSRRR